MEKLHSQLAAVAVGLIPPEDQLLLVKCTYVRFMEFNRMIASCSRSPYPHAPARAASVEPALPAFNPRARSDSESRLQAPVMKPSEMSLHSDLDARATHATRAKRPMLRMLGAAAIPRHSGPEPWAQNWSEAISRDLKAVHCRNGAARSVSLRSLVRMFTAKQAIRCPICTQILKDASQYHELMLAGA